MPLQNRVTPFSSIETSPARGTLTGNRGILHGPHRNLLTQGWRTKAWICCTLTYKNVRRVPMTPGTWTELFFLDEPTALAAGHRPCACCRRAAFKAFLSASGFDRAPKLDAQLHAERLGPKIFADPNTLPDFAFVELDGTAWMKRGLELLEWSHFGYSNRMAARDVATARVLTPQTTIAALRNGYRPMPVSLPVQFGSHV